MFDEAMVLSMLPVTLRVDVRLDMYKDQIEAVPFIPDVTDLTEGVDATWRPVRLSLARALVPLTYMSDEHIVRRGTKSVCMYMITHI